MSIYVNVVAHINFHIIIYGFVLVTKFLCGNIYNYILLNIAQYKIIYVILRDYISIYGR